MVVALIFMPQVASVGVLVDSELGPPEVQIPEFVFCACEGVRLMFQAFELGHPEVLFLRACFPCLRFWVWCGGPPPT